MPRVYTKTAKASKKDRSCTGCREQVEPGQRFYSWTRRFGRTGREYFRHVGCGYPRPTELSSRKTAQIEEAIADARPTLDGFVDVEGLAIEWTPDEAMSVEVDYSELSSVLDDIAGVANEVAAEYTESHDNLPENFQQGSTGQAMEDVASELEDWASSMDGWSPSAETTVDIDPIGPNETVDEWLDRAKGKVAEALEALQAEAGELLDGMPEYQG